MHPRDAVWNSRWLSLAVVVGLATACGDPDVPPDETYTPPINPGETDTPTVPTLTPTQTPAVTPTLEITPTPGTTPTPGVTPTPGATPTPGVTPTATVPPEHDPVMQLSAGTLNFGEVVVGESKEASLTLSNLGAGTLTYTLAVETLQGGALFLGMDTLVDGSVLPGQEVGVTVVFSPDAGGETLGSLLVTSNDPKAASLTVGLAGVGLEFDPNDLDRDGFTPEEGDCNDEDAAIYPFALEACDGKDNDCDNQVDEDGNTYFYQDLDGDGQGNSDTALLTCLPGEGWVSEGTDCDDGDAQIYQGAPEQCDTLDNDCDAEIDEGVTQPFYQDGDLDGYGDAAHGVQACLPSEGISASSDDCDDTNPQRFPGNEEVCDGVDNDCDDQVDEELYQATFYADADQDGFGDPTVTSTGCGPEAGYVTNADDCDDTSALRYPGADEICDGLDNDCDTLVDEDGFSTFYPDEDGDGHGDPASGVELCNPSGNLVALGDDCDDTNPRRFPGNPEVCDGVDNDCDTLIDEEVLQVFYPDIDRDGYGAGSSLEACTQPDGYAVTNTDCDDQNPSIRPGQAEVCNDVDDNCDDQVDEGVLVTFHRDADGDGYGDAQIKEQACEAPEGFVLDDTDCNDGSSSVHPGASETCNLADDDCNGKIDDGLPQVGYYQDIDKDGYGDNVTYAQACSQPGGTVTRGGDCDDKQASVNPEGKEVCDQVDNDCDGQVDEGVTTSYYRDGDGDGYGQSGSSPTQACTAPNGYVLDNTDCDDSLNTVNPGEVEICNQVDDDCNGKADDGLSTNTYYQDGDGDGFGNPSTSVVSCARPSGFVLDGTDCNDSASSVNPKATELCDGVDNNCDKQVDEGLTSSYYPDADKDGYGQADAAPTVACTRPAGYVVDHTDCNDKVASVNPAASESCNQIDDDCDGLVDDGLATSSWYADADKDGYGTPRTVTVACSQPAGYVKDNTDCDDTQATINPAAKEVCDTVDNDCDSQIDEGVQTSYYPDADKDTYGSASATPTQACSQPAGYVTNKDDCDDTNAAVKPGASETCNQVDDNCNGTVDEGLATTTYYQDADADGYGNPDASQARCSKPTGYVTNSADCDDTDASSSPKGTEKCDGKDNDCDLLIDEGVKSFYYVDGDKDGYGKSGSSAVEACTAPNGYVSNNTDCNDGVPSTYPGAPEQCNAVDDNCNGQIDDGVIFVTWYVDNDKDGYGSPSSTRSACTQPAGYVSSSTDCNDANAAINPAATEVCNGLDDDCDGQKDEGVTTSWYKDGDGDSFGDVNQVSQACSKPNGYVADKTDCLDTDATVYPGAPEACDTKDNDCDAQVDEGVLVTFYKDGDRDGYGTATTTTQACTVPAGYATSSTDCNDADATIYPGASELCDSKDNDCDGVVDDGALKTFYKDGDVDGYGDPNASTTACTAPNGYVAAGGDCNDGDASMNPGMLESCDGKDNDCDKQVDEGVKTTWYLDADSDTYGNAAISTQACAQPGGYVANSTDCNDSDKSVNPGATEVCDSQDNDCDTQIDEGVKTTWYRDGDVDSYGNVNSSTQACSKPNGYVTNSTDCNDADSTVNPSATEVCDAKDNDCDALIDEAVKTTYYQDSDVDTYGNAYSTTEACSKPAGYVTDRTDCNDGDATVNPGTTEKCDGKDNDCDTQIDESVQTTYYLDADSDLYGDPSTTKLACSVPSGYVVTGLDCDDSDPLVNPGAPEIPGNGIDDNCDGKDLPADFNNDGYGDFVVSNFFNGSSYQINSYVYFGSAKGIGTPLSLATQGSTYNCVADFDNDGDLDIYFTGNRTAASTYTANGYVYYNVGGTFSSAKVTALPNLGAQGCATGDVNNDGWTDIVVANHYNGTSYAINSYIYLNSATGFSSTAKVELPTLGAYEVAIDDVNNDGYKDIAFSNYRNGTVYTVESYIYLGSKSGYSTTNRYSLPSIGAWRKAVIKDINGDGYKDVLLPNYFNGTSYVVDSYIYWGSSSGYATTNRLSLPANGCSGAHVSDLTGDGYNDIVLYGYRDTDTTVDTYVYLGGPTGYSTSKRQALNSLASVYDGLVYDFNEDGFDDIVLAAYVDADYTVNSRVFYGSSSGYTSTPIDLPTFGSHGVGVVDVDGDTYTDLIFASYYDADYTTSGHIYWGSPRGLVENTRSSLQVFGALESAVADLDKDGWKDIVVPNYSNGSSFGLNSYIYWGAPTGFSKNKLMGLPTQGAMQACVGDLNLDGREDIVYANFRNATTRKVDSFVYWNTTSGFSSTNVTPLPTLGAVSCMIKDLNRDSYPEVVFVNYFNDSTYAVESYVYWNSKGVLSSSNRTALPTLGAYAVVADDLDKNGYVDLVFSNYNNAAVAESYIYWGDATGFSSTRRLGLTSNNPQSEAVIADLNGDSWLDLVFPGYYDGNDSLYQYIYFGGQSGFNSTFMTRLTLYRCLSVKVADVNKDGKPDLIFGTYYDGDDANNSYVYLNVGGNYSDSNRIALPGNRMTDVGVADLDLDGNLDIVLGGFYNAAYATYSSIYYGTGTTPAFNTTNRQQLPSIATYDVKLSDFDNDGMIDLYFSAYQDSSSDFDTTSYVYWNSDRRFNSLNYTLHANLGGNALSVAGAN